MLPAVPQRLPPAALQRRVPTERCRVQRLASPAAMPAMVAAIGSALVTMSR